MEKSKIISRVINLGWFFGLLYFQTLITGAFALKRIKELFQTRSAMLLLAMGILMLAAGVMLAATVMRRTQDDRVHNVVSMATIVLYVASFIGMHIRQPAFSFVICATTCMVVMGYNLMLVNAALASSLWLDKYAGRIIGLATFFCGGLLTTAKFLNLETAFLFFGFVLTIYFFCHPPKQHLMIRNRVLRTDLTIVSTKRTIFNYLSIVAIIGVRCGAGLCLIVPIYNPNSIFAAFCQIAVFFGIGAAIYGFFRDRMSKYLPMLSFCAICLTLVVDTVFGGVKSDHFGMALGQCMAGCAFLYYMCIATDFPANEKPPKMIFKALLTFLCAAGISVAVLSQLLHFADGRTVILAISSLSVVLVLAQLFYDSIYQSHQTPEISVEVRLGMFKSRYALTIRENEVLSQVLTSEKSLKDIAGELYISISTLEKHMTNIYEKTHTKNRSELTHKFFAYGNKSTKENAGNIEQ